MSDRAPGKHWWRVSVMVQYPLFWSSYLVSRKLSSGSFIHLTITLELKKILQNIWRRVVGSVLINISPWNIFLILLLLENYKCQTELGGSIGDAWVWWFNILSFGLSSWSSYLVSRKLSSGSCIHLAITLELKDISQNIWRRVVGGVLINISPWNIFLILLIKTAFICEL